MPVTKVAFKPGVNREATSYANEGQYFVSAWSRFRSGYPEKIGGWQNINHNNTHDKTFKGVARSLYAWATYAAEKLLGIGTSQKFYVEFGGVYNDITPLGQTKTLDPNPFTTTNGSKLVTVYHQGHKVTPGTFVRFTGATPVGGLTLDGEYEIISTPSGDTFAIAAQTAATGSVVGGGGAAVSASYDINAAAPGVRTGSGGWGSGGWGDNGWGDTPATEEDAATVTETTVRLWSQTKYGQDLIFAPRDGAIYYWTANTDVFNRAELLSSKAYVTDKAITDGAATGNASVIEVFDTAGINIGARLTAGAGMPVGSNTFVTAIDYEARFVTLSQDLTEAALGEYAFSHVGSAVPQRTKFVFSADMAKFTVALGANSYNPDDPNTPFDPMLVRWADQDNTFEWVPEQTNQSGEQPLTIGSELVCGVNARQEVLLWSDAALYNMQYIGPPYVFGFTLLSDNISIASQNAVASAQGVQYWMGRDKFYMYNGRVEPLPCTLHNHVFKNIAFDEMDQVVSGTNEGFNEVWWHYPSHGSTINDSYVIFNYAEGTWTYGSLTRTAWLDTPLREHPLGAFSIQTAYLDTALDTGMMQVSLTHASSYPASGTLVIDDEQVRYDHKEGSALYLTERGVNGTTEASHGAYSAAKFLVPNQIMDHEIGLDDASMPVKQPIYSAIGSADFDIGDGHQFAFVTRILPDLTFQNSSADQPRVYLTIKPRVNSGRNYTSNPKPDRPDVVRTIRMPVEEYTGQVYVRLRGRQMQFLLESEDLGVAWQMGAMRIDIRPDGRKV